MSTIDPPWLLDPFQNIKAINLRPSYYVVVTPYAQIPNEFYGPSYPSISATAYSGKLIYDRHDIETIFDPPEDAFYCSVFLFKLFPRDDGPAFSLTLSGIGSDTSTNGIVLGTAAVFTVFDHEFHPVDFDNNIYGSNLPLKRKLGADTFDPIWALINPSFINISNGIPTSCLGNGTFNFYLRRRQYLPTPPPLPDGSPALIPKMVQMWPELPEGYRYGVENYRVLPLGQTEYGPARSSESWRGLTSETPGLFGPPPILTHLGEEI